MRQYRQSIGLALLLIGFLSVLSVAQVARPFRSVGDSASTAITASRPQLTRHALQEVAPRSAAPRPPYATALLPDVPANRRTALRAARVDLPSWPIEIWPVRRLLAPASADSSEPA